MNFCVTKEPSQEAELEFLEMVLKVPHVLQDYKYLIFCLWKPSLPA